MKKSLGCLLLMTTAFNSYGFEWKEARLPEPTIEQVKTSARLGMNVVSLLQAYEQKPEVLQQLIDLGHKKGLKVGVGGHTYKTFLPDNCDMPLDCWGEFMTSYKKWVHEVAYNADYYYFWPTDGKNGSFDSDTVWTIFLKAQKELGDKKMVGLAYHEYVMPPSFSLPSDTIVEVAPYERFGSIPLNEQRIGDVLITWAGTGVKVVNHDYHNRTAWKAINGEIFFPQTMKKDIKFAQELNLFGVSDYGSSPSDVGWKNFKQFARLLDDPNAALYRQYSKHLVVGWGLAKPCGMQFCGDMEAALKEFRKEQSPAGKQAQRFAIMLRPGVPYE